MRGGRNVERSPRSILVTALVIAVALGVALGRPAIAAPTCSYDPETLLLTVTLAPGDAVTLSVGEGNTILVGDSPCATIGGGERSVTRVAVEVGNGPADEIVTVSQAGPGGAFPAGFGFELDLGDGASDRVRVLGNELAETFMLDGRGLVVPLQVLPIGVERFEVGAGGGNDTVDASGSDVDLGSFDLPLAIRGGFGDDTLSGGPEDDHIAGDEGNDTLDGGAGIDLLNGGDGLDTCVLDLVSMACDPSISLEPSTVEANASLTLTGAGWYPENGVVDLSFVPSDGGPSQPLAPVAPDSGWSIGATLVAPTPDGAYSVVACQPCSDPDAERAAQSFTVRPSTLEPTISIEPATVHVGDVVVVSGENWDPAAGPISLFAELPDVPPGEPFAIVSPDEAGAFERAVDIPELAEGPHEVTACQRCDEPDATVKTASFTVEGLAVVTATLELSPPAGQSRRSR